MRTSRKLTVFLLSALTLCSSLFFASEVYAEDYLGSFKTEDGLWDGEIGVYPPWQSTGDVNIQVYDLYRVNWNSGAATYMGRDASALYARLCNKSTGNCTGFKYFGSYDSVDFDNMLPGDYWIDIRDTWGNYYFKGTVDAKIFY